MCCSLLFKLLDTGAYWTCCVCVVLCGSNYWTQQPIGHAVCVLFSVVQTIGHSSLLDMLCVCCSLWFKLLDTAAYWTCCVCVVLCCSNYWTQQPIGHAVSVVLFMYSVVTCTMSFMSQRCNYRRQLSLMLICDCNTLVSCVCKPQQNTQVACSIDCCVQ